MRRVVGVDEDRGIVYFMANAREAGEDPYYQHLYRVNMDGTGLQLVDPGDFDHRTAMGESNRFFVDNYARVNSVPASALYDVSGRKIMDLEVADFSQLVEAGYQFPEPYTVKADDGITDLYGNIYRPFDFDPDKTYPIVAYVYPGPQTEAVSKFFSTNASETALAQFGIIVITVGNRGGHPARSKWYHNYGYGNLRDYGLADKKAAIEQLADRYDYIDIERVGIYGHSGGGFMSTAAMLVYPDFFKVAVSSSGNHDNDVYQANWSEKHDGIKEVVDDRRRSHLRIRHRQELGSGGQPQGPPAPDHVRRRQQRPPGRHPAHGRRAHQGEQAVRFLHLPRPAAQLREYERLLVLAPGRVLRGSPTGERPVEPGHHRAAGGGTQDALTPHPK